MLDETQLKAVCQGVAALYLGKREGNGPVSLVAEVYRQEQLTSLSSDVAARCVAFIGDENADCAPAFLERNGAALWSKLPSIKYTALIRTRPHKQNGYARKLAARRQGFGAISCSSERDELKPHPMCRSSLRLSEPFALQTDQHVLGILLVPSRGTDSAPPATVSTLGGVALSGCHSEQRPRIAGGACPRRGIHSRLRADRTQVPKAEVIRHEIVM
jgi:hypothetical protein